MALGNGILSGLIDSDAIQGPELAERQGPPRPTSIKKVKSGASKSANRAASAEFRKAGAKTATEKLFERNIEAHKENLAQSNKLRLLEKKADEVENLYDKFSQIPPKELLTDEGFLLVQQQFPTITKEKFVNEFAPTLYKRAKAIQQLGNIPIGTELPPVTMEKLQSVGISNPSKYMSVKSPQSGNLSEGAGNVLKGAADVLSQTALDVGRSGVGGGFNPFTGIAVTEAAEAERVSDLEKLQAKSDGKGFERVSIANPETGRTEIVIFDPNTGKFKDNDGKEIKGKVLKGFAPKTVIDPVTGFQSVFNPNTGTFEQVDPETQNANNLSPNNLKQLRSAFDNLEKNELFKKSKSKLAASNEVSLLLEGNKAVAPGLISRAMLRLAGEQRFTDQDVKSCSGSVALGSRLSQLLQTMKAGNFTEENRGLFLELSTLISQKAKKYLTLEVTTQLGRLGDTSTITLPKINMFIDNEIARQNKIPGDGGKPKAVKSKKFTIGKTKVDVPQGKNIKDIKSAMRELIGEGMTEDQVIQALRDEGEIL